MDRRREGIWVANSWHMLTTNEVLFQLHSNEQSGLSPEQAEARLLEVGLNALQGRAKITPWKILWQQFTDFMVLVLLAATVISFLLGEMGDAITIVAIVMMNAILGFAQEYRAEQSVAALKALTAPQAKVIRQGRLQLIEAAMLVPGDVVECEAGDRVPADARILYEVGLEVNESALTGESSAVRKRADVLPDPDLAVGDRRNLLFMGTTINRGRVRALVVETGMNTEMGTIAHLIREAVEDQTPLQRRLAQLGKILVVLSILIVAVVVITGLFRGEPLYQMFLTGVSLAVAAIPEGLPAIVTVALALGVQRMIRAHAVIRRLPAVETLGCTTVICSDKTGTLTKNQMTVTELWVQGDHLVSADGTRWNDHIDQHPQTKEALTHLLTGAALCNNGALAGTNGPQGQGDPTELALLWAASEAGLNLEALARQYHRVGEIPFESERQRMAVSVLNPKNQAFSYVKGSWESVSGRCAWIQIEGKVEPMTLGQQRQVRERQEEMAARALRVLAIAYRPLSARAQPDEMESDLVFLGLIGMIDPPRPEAIRAMADAKRAGVRTVMITGDHPKTARAIAEAMGMFEKGDLIVTGSELDHWSDDELQANIGRVRVYARVSPPHKLRVVRAFKTAGEVVAMTGDGVNDAPAVKEADIGIAMGLSGTDVTKEASAMILSDDNYATIVQAVKEGRAIYDNIRKFIRYLLSCNVGEVLVMFLAAFIGLPLPLLPIQILLINLVTDGLPALALGVDPAVPGLMDHPPRPPQESIFARGLGTKIAFRGILIGVSTLVVFAWAIGPLALGLREARTLALATLVMSQLFHVFDARSEDRNFMEIGVFSNPWAVLAVLSSIAMLVAVIYLPVLTDLFKTSPLSGRDWMIVVFASGFVQLGAVLRSLVSRPRRDRHEIKAFR